MKKIAVYGAGGFGREVACLIKKINQKNPQWKFIGFFDDGIEKGTKNEYGVVLGGIKELNEYSETLSIAIAIALPKVKEDLHNKITNPKIDFPTIISPDIEFLDENNINIGKGNIICRGCWFSCNVSIGDFNIFNVNIIVGHDTSIGDYNSFMTNTILSGEVMVKNRNYFGVGAVVLQQLKIGNDVTVGANSLILRKTKDGMTYVGNPATIMKY